MKIRRPGRQYAWSGSVACAVATLGLLGALAAGGCSSKPTEPITLDRTILTVDNRSGEAWTDVEIWINTYYRITTRSIPPGGRFQAPLGSATAGFGQRFDFNRMQVKDVRLTAKLPDGKPLEVKKEFAASGLAGALGGKR